LFVVSLVVVKHCSLARGIPKKEGDEKPVVFARANKAPHEYPVRDT